MIDHERVHVTHCCRWHGCKYGDPDCPVTSGRLAQEFPCETCDWVVEDLIENTRYRSLPEDDWGL
jgi:hypothetical protein